MTAYLTNYKQTSAMYINIASVINKIYDETGNPIAWALENSDISGILTTAGAAVFRDMGKVIYLPSGCGESRILRKIQYVTSDCTSPAYEAYIGYISIGGQTYGIGDGNATPVARIA